MTRQEALHREFAPLEFAAIVNEAVLYRQVGGPAVMRAQIEHMMDMAHTRQFAFRSYRSKQAPTQV